MVKLLSVILVKTFNKSRFLEFVAARMKSAQKLGPFTLHIRALSSVELLSILRAIKRPSPFPNFPVLCFYGFELPTPRFFKGVSFICHFCNL